MKNEPNYWANIPAKVRYDNGLSSSEKLFYAELTALTNKHGYCWATNNYFAKLYNVNKVTISRWTSKLKEKGYIRTQLVYEGKEIKQRRIYLLLLETPIDNNVNTPIDTNVPTPINNDVNTPIDNNVKGNSTSSNNIKFNNNLYTFDDFYELIWKTYKKINSGGKAEGKDKAKKLSEENLIKLYKSVLVYKDYSQFEGYKHCLIATFIYKKRYLDDWKAEKPEESGRKLDEW